MESGILEKKKKDENTFKITSLYNIDYEETVIKSLVKNNKVFESIAEILKDVHFYSPANAIFYRAICEIIKNNGVADYATIAQSILKEKINNPHDVIFALESIIDSDRVVYQEYMMVEAAKTLGQYASRRRLIKISENLAVTSGEGNLNIIDIISNLEKDLNSVTIMNAAKEIEAISKVTGDVIRDTQKGDKRAHIKTGFCDIDKLIGSFMPSDLIIIAARPSMGKTALAINIAQNIGLQKKDNQSRNVLFFSLEMSSEQIGTRVLSSVSSVDSDKIRFGKVLQSDIEKFVDAQKEISKIKVFIDDTPRISTDEMFLKSRRFARKNGLDAIFVDYLQLITHKSSTKSENRVQEISEITMFLKGLAKELKVPVVALSQLSRAVESRDDKRPQLSDLRESGSIEQDADMVMFIYREEYYLERKVKEYVDIQKQKEAEAQLSNARNKADIIVAKNRNGQIGGVKLHYEPKYTRFANLLNEVVSA